VKVVLAALFSGTLFGAGLAWSGMTNPARVLGFLDITGNWDPTLVLVMGGALAVSASLFPLVLRRPHPVLTKVFALPSNRDLDARLLGGAAVFGVGWGLAGLCPGPAIAGLITGSPAIVLFVTAMLPGQWLGWVIVRQDRAAVRQKDNSG
jgi:uncharacterized membrane protein YedE/YeeE